MAPLLAPYHNAMRFGQGFNSYTQQICLEDAVTPIKRVGENTTSGARHEGGNGNQIVSYSSRFVEKLSDIAESMNVSAAYAIKNSRIGGPAGGSFVDIEKFQASDLNFLIQVRVTNKTESAENYKQFQRIDSVQPSKLTRIYGDTFICGFEEGGELNALISVYIDDKDKISTVKGELEGWLLGKTPLSGESQGKIEFEKSNLYTSCRTDITVNWRGGGENKATNEQWDLKSLAVVVSNFPDMVARAPQRTYAVLKKYTSLRTFHEQIEDACFLNFEDAGSYSTTLLDLYMDYSVISKQIQSAAREIQAQRAGMREAKVADEITSAKVTRYTSPEPAASTSTDTSSPANDAHLPMYKSKYQLESVQFKAYPATALGLDNARRDCRLEMTKIKNEVDEITRDPTLALDSNRESYFTSSAIFRQLLPVVTLLPPHGPTSTSVTVPKSSVLLGSPEAAMATSVWIDDRSTGCILYATAVKSVEKHKDKAVHFSMGSEFMGLLTPPFDNIFFNDLDLIDISWKPVSFTMWNDGQRIAGIKTTYSNGKMITHGQCDGELCKTVKLGELGKDRILRVVVGHSTIDNVINVNRVVLTDNFSKSTELSPPRVSPGELNTPYRSFKTPPGFYSLRGFWGATRPETVGISLLGAVWGKDEPDDITKPVVTTLSGK